MEWKEAIDGRNGGENKNQKGMGEDYRESEKVRSGSRWGREQRANLL